MHSGFPVDLSWSKLARWRRWKVRHTRVRTRVMPVILRNSRIRCARGHAGVAEPFHRVEICHHVISPWSARLGDAPRRCQQRPRKDTSYSMNNKAALITLDRRSPQDRIKECLSNALEFLMTTASPAGPNSLNKKWHQLRRK